MIGFIQAAGYGSRLYPLTLGGPNKASLEKKIPREHFNVNFRPKPLAPITNCPMIYSSLLMMRSLGVDKIFVSTGSYHDIFVEHFKSIDIPVMLSRKTSMYDTVKAEMNNGYKGPVVVLSGDIISNIDARPALEAHIKEGALATIVSTPITPDVRSCSPVVIEDTGKKFGKVMDYRHKFPRSEALKLSKGRNSSIYIFDSGFFEMANRKFGGRYYDFSEDVFPWLVSDKDVRFLGYRSSELWADVGELDYYLNVQKLSLKREFQFPYDGEIYSGSMTYRVGGHRIIGPSLVQNGCELGTGCTIGPFSVIGKGWEIGNNSVIAGSILWPADNALAMRSDLFRVKNNTSVVDSIIGSGSIISDVERKAVVHNGAENISYGLNVGGSPVKAGTI